MKASILGAAAAMALGLSQPSHSIDPAIDETEIRQVGVGQTERDVVQTLGPPIAVLDMRPGVVTYVYEGLTEPGDEPAFLYVDIRPDGAVAQYYIEKAGE